MKKADIYTKELLKFVINLMFAVYNCVIGIVFCSVWFITVGTYYIILSTMRILVTVFTAKNKKNETFVMKFTGFMIFALAVVLCVFVYVTIRYDVSTAHNEIVMITIALYAFVKLTLAITGFVKTRKNHRLYVKTVNGISFVDAVVSIYSLQKSMLVSFEGMTPGDITLFNTISGIGMCVIVICVGLYLIIGKDVKNGKIKNSTGK